jgi:predicted nucleic acid-binding protein
MVIDSNILIDYLNGRQEAQKFILSNSDLSISIITWMEVLIGNKNDNEVVKSFLSTFDIIHLNLNIAGLAVELRRNMKIKLPDAIIYATAKYKNTKLITRNTKDFNKKLKDVKIPYILS